MIIIMEIWLNQKVFIQSMLQSFLDCFYCDRSSGKAATRPWKAAQKHIMIGTA